MKKRIITFLAWTVFVLAAALLLATLRMYFTNQPCSKQAPFFLKGTIADCRVIPPGAEGK